MKLWYYSEQEKEQIQKEPSIIFETIYNYHICTKLL